MRVISGTAGGLRLSAPRLVAARPTTDRVKESVFGALGRTVTDAAVLDLYAGSGALGIEALSRGADRAVFVERSRRAVPVIRTNLRTTKLQDRARVQESSVHAFLGRLAREAPFDLVFVDPPYDVPTVEIERVLASLAEPGWLVPGATVVLERSKTSPPPTLPAGWTVRFERAYGDTLVLAARC
jgi:16S rRNA (guanine966-N2)-methyltransferase